MTGAMVEILPGVSDLRCSDRWSCAGPRRSRTYSGQSGPKACSDSTSNPSLAYHSMLARAFGYVQDRGHALHRSSRHHGISGMPSVAELGASAATWTAAFAGLAASAACSTSMTDSVRNLAS